MTGAIDAYVRSHGVACPVCGARDLDRAPATIIPECVSGRLTVWVGCEGCRSTWQEIYQLVDCAELSDADGKPADASVSRFN